MNVARRSDAGCPLERVAPPRNFGKKASEELLKTLMKEVAGTAVHGTLRIHHCGHGGQGLEEGAHETEN